MSTLVKADATGVVTLPAELCRAAGLGPGIDLVVEVQDGRIVLERRRQPIWERIAALAADAPPEEIAKLPADGAAQIDHYLYGHPKRPE
ncbi:MAG TPA: AbrB/MazE/SpoVT family DNA-binding domain-containing protein [Gemmataceae bacterium]|nr:AbrB/MazE/SpoVT family DNA-binding domain-containing protein [Gemmataceae bacterium]